jgi:hypothetical protein
MKIIYHQTEAAAQNSQHKNFNSVRRLLLGESLALHAPQHMLPRAPLQGVGNRLTQRGGVIEHRCDNSA